MKKGLLFSFILLISNINISECQLSNVLFKTDSLSFLNQSDVIDRIRESLRIETTIDLVINNDKTYQDDIGFTHYSFDLFLDSIQIENSNIKAHAFDNKIVSISGAYKNNIKKGEVIISELNAFNSLCSMYDTNSFIWIPSNLEIHGSLFDSLSSIHSRPIGELKYLLKLDQLGNEISDLCYRFDIFTVNPINREYVYVSAQDGSIVNIVQKSSSADGTVETKYSGTKTVKTTFQGSSLGYSLSETGGNRCYILSQFNGTFFRDEDNIWTAAEYDNSNMENATLDLHWGSEMFYDYFKITHNRLSWNNTNGSLHGMYMPQAFDQAKWIGGSAVFYKGEVKFSPLTSIDIVAHEFAHGITDATCDLVVENESGAINESLSDIWAACVEFYADPNKNKWLIGEEISLLRNSERSLINPKDENHPDTYFGEYWYPLSETPDNSNNFGGIHSNSGVMNHWFYLLSEGGAGTNDNNSDYSILGIGMEKAAKIVYRAQTIYFTATTTFLSARDFTIQSTRDLYGNCSQEVESVIRAWHAVGVGVSLEEANSIVLTQNILSNQMDYQYVYSTITALNNIENQAVAVYEASTSVEFKNGFHAEEGSSVHASITECNLVNGGIQKITNNSAQIEDENSEVNSNLNLLVFPNPVESSFQLRSSSEYENQYLSLVNSLGQTVYKVRIGKTNALFNIDYIEKGLYFLFLNGKSTNVKINKL